MPTLKLSSRSTALACLVLSAVSVCSWAQESRGFKYNNLSVSPYVNLEYTYDSNANYQNGDNNTTLNADGSVRKSDGETADSSLRVNPGVDLSYQGNEWGLKGNAWYAYEWYKEQDQLNSDSYGESVDVYRESAKGWRLLLGQSYVRSTENDSIIDGGNGLWRDRNQFDFTGALAYQFSEKTGATLSGMYSDLSYSNDSNQYDPLYGWQEWTVGLELSRKLTEKSNLLLSGSYEEYTSDGAKKVGDAPAVDDSSTGYTLQAGFGSRATERISYRLLTGASWFKYGEEDMMAGWVYSVDASWLINKKWAASLAGSSNFQPSEREANQAMQCYTLAGGLTYKPARRLSTRFDVSYRREENQNDVTAAGASTDDQYALRARADYQLRRYVTLYGGVESDQLSDDKENEFDRYQATLGLNFRY